MFIMSYSFDNSLTQISLDLILIIGRAGIIEPFPEDDMVALKFGALTKSTLLIKHLTGA